MEPLAPRHHDDLVEATRDGELWRLGYTAVPSPEGMAAEIARRLGLQKRGEMLAFAAVDPATAAAVGMTAYMNVDAPNRRLEIGSTWYRRRVQRTALNTEAKLLLFEHAFERLDCIAVELRTSTRNLQSRAAIARLGAKLDGILRSHQHHPDGSLRDTAVYSIVAAEWPTIRVRLEELLARPR